MLSPVSAVEQLQGMAVKRQYKEAAGQLEVGIELFKCPCLGSISGNDSLDGITCSPVAPIARSTLGSQSDFMVLRSLNGKYCSFACM